eukprot:291936-Lingulodinium_polyedra.AAC.1
MSQRGCWRATQLPVCRPQNCSTRAQYNGGSRGHADAAGRGTANMGTTGGLRGARQRGAQRSGAR